VRVSMIVLALLFLTAAVYSQPLSYHLSGGTFADGGTFGGSFSYDASTDVYSSINVVTTPGTTRPAGATYLFVCGSPDTPACGDGISPFPNSVIFLPNTGSAIGQPSLFLVFGSLANELFSATVFVTGDNEGDCTNAACTTVTAATDRHINNGGTIGSSEPLFEYLYFGS